jgi:hypothetical protein
MFVTGETAHRLADGSIVVVSQSYFLSLAAKGMLPAMHGRARLARRARRARKRLGRGRWPWLGAERVGAPRALFLMRRRAPRHKVGGLARAESFAAHLVLPGPSHCAVGTVPLDACPVS